MKACLHGPIIHSLGLAGVALLATIGPVRADLLDSVDNRITEPNWVAEPTLYTVPPNAVIIPGDIASADTWPIYRDPTGQVVTVTNFEFANEYGDPIYATAIFRDFATASAFAQALVASLGDPDNIAAPLWEPLNGTVVWDPRKVGIPGIQVINDDPGGDGLPATDDDLNCIMASLSEQDLNNTCAEQFKARKRFTLSVVEPSPQHVDLLFTVSPDATRVYINYAQLQNLIGSLLFKPGGAAPARIDRFTLELGFGVGADFVRSDPNDGLRFSDPAGGPPVAFATFPQTLFGDVPDPDSGAVGFFDPFDEAGFDLLPREDLISSVTDSLSSSYRILFGDWLPEAWVPWGYYLDHDARPSTDPVLVGYWDGRQWLTRWDVGLFPRFVPQASLVPVDPAAQGWTTNPLYTVAPIVGLSLLDLDYWIKLDLNSAATLGQRRSMTLRVAASTSSDTSTPWLAALPDEIPIAVDDSYTTNRGTVLSVDAPGVLANDVDDNDGVPLSAFLVDPTVHGDVELADNGYVRYLPDLGFVGTDTFTYYASDGTARSNIATVTITVLDADVDSDGDGGGCTIQRNGPFEPTLPLVVLGSIVYLALRARRRQIV